MNENSHTLMQNNQMFIYHILMLNKNNDEVSSQKLECKT
jgi:hypothetical protein